jgi:hypothetical protein
MQTRRSFLALAGAAAALPLRAAPRARVESVTTISYDPQYYIGWPTVTRRKNGQLVVVWSGGRERHVCPFGRVELMRSNDDGKSWTWPEVVWDSPTDDRDAGILETSRGTLLVTTFTSDAWEKSLAEAKDWPAERLARWRALAGRATPEQRKALLGCWMLRSTDGGMLWSAAYRVPVNSPHGPIQLADGRLLYAGKKLWEPTRSNGVAESSDDGQTWRWLSEIPTRPGDSFDPYCELHAVQAASGKILVHIRNHNQANAGETLQCESTDGGKTWSMPHAIGVWGLPSHLLRLSDGRLVMTYGYRRPPRGNMARISEDEGKSWSDPITLSDDGTGDLGYPSTVELAPGRLLSIWYEKRTPETNAVLRQALWNL